MVTFSVRNRKIRLPKGTTVEEANSMTEFFEKKFKFFENHQKGYSSTARRNANRKMAKGGI
mgnify:CR=1 FL=1